MSKSQEFIKLTEAGKFDQEVSQLSGAMTRLLIGDRDNAIRQIKNIISKIEGDPERSKELAYNPGLYTEEYRRIYSALVTVVDSALFGKV